MAVLNLVAAHPTSGFSHVLPSSKRCVQFPNYVLGLVAKSPPKTGAATGISRGIPV